MSEADSESRPAIEPDLLEVLRCPVAVRYTDKGDDPGREDSGYRYPIRDGIPVMLVEEAEQWKDVPVQDLPVPPPDES